ncbi:hypothetical protein M5689_024390 [Euphorbia peplus]|nr:hypothetical protein M5689_024390 [Euphorbia peplus]
MDEHKPVIRKRPRVFDHDDGSFDRIVQKTQRLLLGSGTDSDPETTNLLSLKVLEALANVCQKTSQFKKVSTVDQEKIVLDRKSEGTKNRCDDGGDCETKKAKRMIIHQKKKDGIIRFYDEGLEPPSLSTNLEKRIEKKGGTDLKLVIMKRLHDTDLDKHQARLTIPLIQIRDKSFLATPEISVLISNDKLPAMLLAPCGHEINMVFTKWRFSKSFSYALTKCWNQVLDRNLTHNYFKLGDVIQIWSFKVAGQLWFAMDKVWDAPSA